MARGGRWRYIDMMGPAFWDSALRGAAVALFFLLTLFFLREARRSLAARMGALLAFGGICYVVLIAVDSQYGFANPWRLPLHIASLATPALFWPFAAAWFDDEFELRWVHWVFVVATALTGLVTNYLFFIAHYSVFVLALGWRAFSMISIILGLRATLKGWSSDLVESRRRVRIALAFAVALAILWIVFSELLTRDWPPSSEWRILNAATMLGLASIISLATLGWRDPALLAAPVKSSGSTPRPEADDSLLLSRLDTDMRHERLYRQDGLTITAVAARLDGGRVDHIFAPPTVLAKILGVYDGRRVAGIRTIFCGTAPLLPGLYAKARAVFGPVIRVTYGKSEITNPIATLSPAETDAYYSGAMEEEGVCVGFPGTGVEIETRNEAGEKLPRGEVGEIHLRGRHMSSGHFDASGFVPLPPDGFHATGDYGRIDARGRLHLVGRVADVIKSGGYKIHPDEIERVLSGTAGTRAVAIVHRDVAIGILGRDHRRRGRDRGCRLGGARTGETIAGGTGAPQASACVS